MSDRTVVRVCKVALGAAVIALSACTACPHVGSGQAYAMGWRSARVSSLLDDPQQPTYAVKDCRQALGGPQAPARYALVSYAFTFNPNLRNAMVAALPEGASVAVGDRVWVNVKDCALPVHVADEAPH